MVFRDFSKLQCHEIIDVNGEIESYYYNWNDSNGNLIMKFHAHFHPSGTPYEIARNTVINVNLTM
ncbi:toxin-antitoxin system TumE family protein [Paenibacillus thiaminolyticus]|uniref:toxin-antitoxin system TumE family protein n=1 Tax=Paenibacillus thiaminolyticus TaxID=49283 RepID=UPI003B984B3F